jgi:hypothetical protein
MPPPARPQPQGKIRRMHPPRRGIGRLQHRLELVHLGFDVMVAAVHQQPNPQLQIAGGAFRRQPVGDIAGVGARLQPDALLQHDIADRETPDRHPPFQMERFEMNVAAGLTVDTGPAIAEQRNFPVAIHQGGVGLGEHQPAIRAVAAPAPSASRDSTGSGCRPRCRRRSRPNRSPATTRAARPAADRRTAPGRSG